LHELQKINCYTHVFLHYLQVLELVGLGCGSLKNKVQVLESRWNVFASIWVFFMHFDIDMVNIPILFFWLTIFFFITKIIPQPLKNDKIIGEYTFGVLFQVQMVWHKLLWEARRRLSRCPWRRLKVSFVLKC
jgi:hypothetical protein